MNRHFVKADKQMTNKHIKSCLASLLIKKMKNYNKIPTKRARIKNSE